LDFPTESVVSFCKTGETCSNGKCASFQNSSVTNSTNITNTENQNLIIQIQQQIEILQNQLFLMIKEQQLTTPQEFGVSWCHNFNGTLIQGNTTAEVYSLQTALQKEGYSISSSEIENFSFGGTTLQAVKSFQQRYASEILTPYKLKYGTGIVGLRTREKLNQLYGCNN
jgi:hypothetical protein